jgi:hypothetical protein
LVLKHGSFKLFALSVCLLDPDLFPFQFGLVFFINLLQLLNARLRLRLRARDGQIIGLDLFEAGGEERVDVESAAAQIANLAPLLRPLVVVVVVRYVLELADQLLAFAHRPILGLLFLVRVCVEWPGLFQTFFTVAEPAELAIANFLWAREIVFARHTVLFGFHNFGWAHREENAVVVVVVVFSAIKHKLFEVLHQEFDLVGFCVFLGFCAVRIAISRSVLKHIRKAIFVA